MSLIDGRNISTKVGCGCGLIGLWGYVRSENISRTSRQREHLLCSSSCPPSPSSKMLEKEWAASIKNVSSCFGDVFGCSGWPACTPCPLAPKNHQQILTAWIQTYMSCTTTTVLQQVHRVSSALRSLLFPSFSSFSMMYSYIILLYMNTYTLLGE